MPLPEAISLPSHWPRAVLAPWEAGSDRCGLTFLTCNTLDALHSLSLLIPCIIITLYSFVRGWCCLLPCRIHQHPPGCPRGCFEAPFWPDELWKRKALASAELTLALGCRPAAEPETPDHLPRCGGCTSVHALRPVG